MSSLPLAAQTCCEVNDASSAGVPRTVGPLGAHWEAESSALVIHGPLHFVCLTLWMLDAHTTGTGLGGDGGLDSSF